MVNETRKILDELKTIRIDIEFIKEHIEDITLTEDDIKSLEEAEREFKEGKTISHERLKKELGL